MATNFSHWPLLLITFLMVNSLLTFANEITQREITLVKEPDDNYYIVKKLPVVIVCQAKNAEEISFTCMGTQIPPTSVEVKDVSEIDPDLIEAEIEVTRADVQNYGGQTPFWCECSAVDIHGHVAATSKKGYVSIANLKNKFGIQPLPTTAIVGDNVEFACEAPEGEPKPEIMWRKDKKRLETENNPRFLVNDKQSLIIQSVTMEDMGEYQCVARNVAGRRESEEARLTVAALIESAEPDTEVSEEVVSDQKVSGFGKPRTTRQSTKTYFVNEPQDKYYITEGKPLHIDCGVVAADILTFRCNGIRMNRSLQTFNQGLDNLGNRVIQSQLTITYSDVYAFLAQYGEHQTYQCLCIAWYREPDNQDQWKMLDSNPSRGFVHLTKMDSTFRAEPSDVTAGVNSDAIVICEPPKGQPNPWVHWYKDGTRLDTRSTQKFTVNAKGHLTIHNVQYSDAGLYNCIANNSVTELQSRSGRLIVSADAVITTPALPKEDVPDFPAIIPDTPRFILDLDSENTLEADGTKALVCSAISADRMTIECIGQRLAGEKYEYKTKEHPETGKYLLYIKAVITAEEIERNPDNYFCQCQAWHFNPSNNQWERHLSTKGFVTQRTETAYIDNEFVTSPVNTDAEIESDATLDCEPPAGIPTPKVYWLKDGVRIDSEVDTNFVILETGSLVLESVRDTDEGEYICAAENEAGSRRTQPIKLTVIGSVDETTPKEDESYSEVTDVYETNEVHFGHDLEADYYVADDKPVTLSCTVINAKTLIFVCNGEALRETITTGYHYQHPQSQQIIRENSLIVTKEKVEEYQGSQPYTCLCRAMSSSKDMSIIESSPAAIHVAYLDEYLQVQPSITETVYFGTVELLCTPPNGVPEPKISWLKNDSLVSESERIKIQDSSLIIERFETNDVGVYKCVANNSFFTTTSQPAIVTITDDELKPTPKPDIDEPEPETTPLETETLYTGSSYISKNLHHVYYLAKRQVTITCEAYNVNHITFVCGMQTVNDIDSKEKMEESWSDGEKKLIKVVEATINVSKAEVENFEPGKYSCQCFAHYRSSDAEEYKKLSSVKGLVEIAFIKKNFLKEPENKTIEEGNSVAIQCEPPVAKPLPKVTWTKDGVEIDALSISPSGVLLITEAQLEQAGEYICIAENVAGKKMSPPIQVVVKAKGSSSVPTVKDTEEIIDDGDTGESSRTNQTNVDESDIYSEPNGEVPVVTESTYNRETELSIDMEKSEAILDGGKEKNISVEWPVTEREPKQNQHVKEIVDYVDETVVENKDEYHEGRNENKSKEYKGRDRVNDKYEDQNEDYEVRYSTKDVIEYEDNEGQDEGKDNSDEEEGEDLDTDEDENLNGIGRRKSVEGNECAKILSSCNILQRNKLDLCAVFQDYTACLDNYFEMCSGKVNDITMNAVKSASKDIRKKCSLQQKCSKLEQCISVSSNSLDNSMDNSDLSVQNLCKDYDKLLNCVDLSLEDCNVTMSAPVDGRASLRDINLWFKEYCSIVSRSPAECDELKVCKLHIDKVADNNASYWCSHINSLERCTENAFMNCELEELENHLKELHHEIATHCSDGVINEPWPEITAEPEGNTDSKEVIEPEPAGNADTNDPPTDDDGNGEVGNNENTEGYAVESNDNGNGSTVLGTSIILATILQLLTVVSLSWR